MLRYNNYTMVNDDDWDDIQQVLNADIEFDDPEVQSLYSDMARYAGRAEVLQSHGGEEDAEYFKELAVDAYDSFVPVVQMKKDAEEYGLRVYDDGIE